MKQAVLDFQSGNLDAIIMNASASTGISLHADKDMAADKRRRVMFIGQMQLDVNTEVQTRGRIDRTNQVQRGEYVYVISDIPAETRTLVSFKKKMRSLDANTSANQNVKTSDINVTDFINKFGDLAVAELLMDNIILDSKLLFPMDSMSEPYRGLALKATGRVNLLPVAEQEAFYQEVVQRYNEILEEKNALGENDLEVTTLNYKAKTLDSSTYIKGSGGESAFGSDVILENMEVDVLRKPMKLAQVKEVMGQYADQDIDSIRLQADAKFQELLAEDLEDEKKYYESLVEHAVTKIQEKGAKEGLLPNVIEDEIKSAKDAYNIKLTESLERLELKYRGQRDETNRLFNRFRPGQKVMIPTMLRDDNGSTANPGIFAGYKFREKSRNPYTASNIRMTFIPNDGRGKMPLKGNNKFWIDGISEATMGGYSILRHDLEDFWTAPNDNVRENVVMMTGNLLKAVGEIGSGKMVQFTTEEGSIRKGYLMNEGFKPAKLKQKVKPSSPEAVEILKKGEPLIILGPDGGKVMEIVKDYYGYEVSVAKSKKLGGRYYLDEDLRDLVADRNFYTKGSKMVADISNDRIDKFLKVLDGMGVKAEYEIPGQGGALPKIGDGGVGSIKHEDLTDTKQALNKIGSFFKGDPQIERAVAFLQPIIAANPNIKVIEARPGEYANPRVLAYSYPDGTITLNYDSLYTEDALYRTLLHEMIHAATRHEIEKNPAFKAELENILADVRQVLRLPDNETMISTFMQMGLIEDNKYGATNAHEMVAEVFSNKEFHDYLNQHYYKGQTTLLQRVINGILEFFSKAYKQLAIAKKNIEANLLADYIISLTEQVVAPNPARLSSRSNALPAMTGPNYPVNVVKDFIRKQDAAKVDTKTISKALQGSLKIGQPEADALIQQALNEPFANSSRQKRSQVADVLKEKESRIKKATEAYEKKKKKAKTAKQQQKAKDEFTAKMQEIDEFGYGPELQDGQRQRGLTYRIAPMLTEDIRRDISDNARVYFIKRNKTTLAEAEDFINQHSTDDMFNWLITRPEVLDGMPLDLKVFIYGSAIKKLLASADQDKMAMDFDKAKEIESKAAQLLEVLSPFATELGRAVQAFTIMGKFAKQILPAYADGLIKNLEKQVGRPLTADEKAAIKQLAAEMKDAGSGLPQAKIAAQLMEVLGKIKVEKVKMGELLSAIWYAHILSGPGTHVKNTVANFFNSFAEFMIKSFIELKKTKDIGVLPVMVNAWWEGLAHGYTEAKTILNTGLTRETVQKFGQSPLFEWFRWEDYLGAKSKKPTLAAIGRKMDTRWALGFSPKNLKYVGRMLAAADAMLYTANSEMASAAMAYENALLQKQTDPNLKVKQQYREIMGKDKAQVRTAKATALAEGFDPKTNKTEYNQRVYELIKQARGQAINDAGDRYGAKVTFNHEPDGIMKPLYDTMTKVHEKHVAFRFFVPFLRIVTNLMENWMTWGPIGAIKAYKGSGTVGSKYFRKLSPDEITEYYTKAAIGTVITTLLLAAATDDDDDDFIEISGNGTGDLQKNYELQKSGWREYSIKVNGKIMSYKDTPLFPMLAAVGAVSDHYKFGNGDPNDPSFIEKLIVASNGYAASLFDQSWMQGVDDLVSSVKSENRYGQPASIPEKFFEGMVLNPARSILMSNLAVQINRGVKEMLDEPIKRASGVEKIYRDMPWMNGEWFSFGDPMKPIIDVWGDPVVPKQHLAWLPFKAELAPPDDDPVNDFLAKKKIWVGRPERKEIYDSQMEVVRPMTDDEYYEYMKMAGQLSKRNIKRLLDDGALQQMDKVSLRKTIDSQRTMARQEAFNSLFHR
jgi:hypothetical protein